MAARDKPVVRRYAGKAKARLAYALGPATKQIFARPADPLSVATSYVILRNGIGVLGLAFPVVLIAGAGLDNVQASLSAYYHFNAVEPGKFGAGTMRDAFVGMLCAIGAFLFFYRGHSLQEDLALNVAGIAAVLVAMVPMDWPVDGALEASASARIHSLSAIIFFVMIAYVCVFRARDTLCLMDDLAARRFFEGIYLLLGLLMLATPAAVMALELFAPNAQNGFATLIVEVAGVFVFAAFWLVKSWEIGSSVRMSHPGRAG